MIDESKIYTSFNLKDLGLLPVNWLPQIAIVAEKHSYLVKLDGKSSTSRESENFKGAEVYVVEGDIIANKLNWLHRLYQNTFLKFANNNFNKSFECAQDIKVGLNINYLKGIGAKYEWHVDSNPLTGVLFITTHEKGDGGELVFKLPDTNVIVYPQSGTLILFDAREIPHTVLPLKK